MEDEFWTGIVKRAAKHQHINRRSQFSRHFNRIQTLPDDKKVQVSSQLSVCISILST